LDFVGEFKDNFSNRYLWILIAIKYFTTWVEAIPTKKETKEDVMNFFEYKITTRFGAPTKITTNNANDFISFGLSNFCFMYGNVLSLSSNYWPQNDELAKYSNNNLMNIIEKDVGDNK
jgi:hypothetical protein